MRARWRRSPGAEEVFFVCLQAARRHIATLEFLRKIKLPIDTILYKGTAPHNADSERQRAAFQWILDGAAALALREGACCSSLEGAH